MSQWFMAQRAYNEVNTDVQNRTRFSNDKIIGAASFGAFKMFEDSQRREGSTISHHFAKGFLVGLVDEEVKRIFQERRMNIDNMEMVQNAARKNIETMYDQRFWDTERYDPNNAPAVPGGRDFGDEYSRQTSSRPVQQSWNGGRESYGAPAMIENGGRESYGTPRMIGNGSRQEWSGAEDNYRSSAMTVSQPRQGWSGAGDNYQSSGMGRGEPRQAWNGAGETYRSPGMGGNGSRQGWSGSGENYRSHGMAGGRTATPSNFAWD